MTAGEALPEGVTEGEAPREALAVPEPDAAPLEERVASAVREGVAEAVRDNVAAELT